MNNRFVNGAGLALILALACRPAAAQSSDAPAPAPAAEAPPATSVSKTAQSEAGDPRANAPARQKTGDQRSDRVDLDTTTVTGNRELPKVMYVVPWKKSDIGDFVGKPMNSLLDEVLAPVDRDVFRREVVYYRAVKADATQNSAPGTQPVRQVEK